MSKHTIIDVVVKIKKRAYMKILNDIKTQEIHNTKSEG